MRCDIIHETVIRDIVDMATDIAKADSFGGFLNRGKSFKSVTAASSNLILVFPVPASTDIPIEYTSMVCKAIERQATGMMQMLFSALQVSDTGNAVEYLQQFHTNLDMKDTLDVDEFISIMDRNIEREHVNIVNTVQYEQAKQDLRNLCYVLPDSLSESSISRFKVREINGDTVVLEAPNNIADNYNKMAGGHKSMSDFTNQQVISTDVKKANELMPTLMLVNFTSTNKDNYKTEIANVVVGIKAKIYPVQSQDIINRMVSKNKDNNGFNAFIRATTREISFWKDLVFAVDKAKVDALSNSKKGSSSKLWKLLERRAVKSKIRRALGQENDATAITTLIVSKNEVEYIKKEHNIDIMSPRIIKPILDSYNLMGIVVVDEITETTAFFFDCDEEFELVPFTHLEREAADNSYKKIVNLVSKMK